MREQDIDEKLVAQLEKCRADIQEPDNLSTFAQKIGAMVEQFNLETQSIQKDEVPSDDSHLQEHIEMSSKTQTASQNIVNMISIAKQFADDIE